MNVTDALMLFSGFLNLKHIFKIRTTHNTTMMSVTTGAATIAALLFLVSSASSVSSFSFAPSTTTAPSSFINRQKQLKQQLPLEQKSQKSSFVVGTTTATSLSLFSKSNIASSNNDEIEIAASATKKQQQPKRKQFRVKIGNDLGDYDPSKEKDEDGGSDTATATKDTNVGDPQSFEPITSSQSFDSILKELKAIQNSSKQKYCILGTRHCSYLHQQIIELLYVVLLYSDCVLVDDHRFTTVCFHCLCIHSLFSNFAYFDT